MGWVIIHRWYIDRQDGNKRKRKQQYYNCEVRVIFSRKAVQLTPPVLIMKFWVSSQRSKWIIRSPSFALSLNRKRNRLRYGRKHTMPYTFLFGIGDAP